MHISLLKVQSSHYFDYCKNVYYKINIVLKIKSIYHTCIPFKIE